jgi:hypothetical protein
VWDALKRTGPALSMAAHAVIVAAFLVPHQSPPQLIPISIATIAQWEHHALESDAVSTSIKPEAKQSSRDISHFAKTGHLVEKPTRASAASNPNYLIHKRRLAAQPQQSTLVPSARSPVKQYLLDAAPLASRRMALIEQQQPEHPDKSHITVTGRTDWQSNLVEDNKLTYAVRGTGVRLTVREASSAGFLGTNFSGTDTSPSFAQAPNERPVNSAISQKMDWTVVDSKNFGMTVFGYQNQVGSGFKPFGETKTEFSTAGMRTMKFGGQVRVGALGAGFAQSVANAEDPRVNSSATQSEASVSLALSQLMSDMEPSVSKLLPTSLWASFSDKRTLNIGPQTGANNTTSTSFGGAWNWDNGYTSLGYWSYSSGKNPALGGAWNGRGIDANFGTFWSSFGLNVGFSYGRSEDATASWQSASALYFSSATVSYKPERFPAIWMTAGWGNYDHNAILNGGTLSDLYSVSTKGAYTSLTAGLDLTNWLRTDQIAQAKTLTGPSSVKLLYRYTENAISDGSATPRKEGDSLVAVMTQGKF